MDVVGGSAAATATQQTSPITANAASSGARFLIMCASSGRGIASGRTDQTAHIPHGNPANARPASLVDVVDNGVTAAARDQPPVDRDRHHERDRQADGEAPPEEAVGEPGCHGPGDDEDERVVD